MASLKDILINSNSLESEVKKFKENILETYIIIKRINCYIEVFLLNEQKFCKILPKTL